MISIITINYNNASGLERTILSVISQSFTDFEYIVIDGASNDGSQKIIEAYSGKITYWISEPDNGIYNAMNKGIIQAKGEYLLFINSGDTLYDYQVLANVFQQQRGTDLIYGDLHRIFPDLHTDVVCMPERIDIQRMFTSTLAHPVTFIKRYLFEKYGLYREDLKIVSDWAFFFKIITFGRISQEHIPIVISTFYMDGLSSHEENQRVIKAEKEKVIIESFSYELLEIYNLYGGYRNFYNKKIFKTIRRIKSWINYFKKPHNWIEYIHLRRIHPLIWLANKTVRSQKSNPLNIPIVIINYNRLEYLKELVGILIERKHKNIVIVDNHSSYLPLLEYYKAIQDKVAIEYMDQNYGHMVFWENEELFKKYSKGYYIITDSDIIPNSHLPQNYVKAMMKILDKNRDIVKVGFALKTEDIPDTFQQKQEVVKWEKQYWETPVGNNIYRAKIDTTFAIYPPLYKFINRDFFFQGIRLAGDFTAKHGGWYINNKNLTEEDKYYFQRATTSSSWRLDENGNYTGRDFYKNTEE